jgi:hypothetical protein
MTLLERLAAVEAEAAAIRAEIAAILARIGTIGSTRADGAPENIPDGSPPYDDVGNGGE